MKKLRCIMHIGLDTYPILSEDFATKYIWEELAKAAETYVVIARSVTNKLRYYEESNIRAYFLPKLAQPLYALTSLFAIYLARRFRPEIIVVQEPAIGGTTARLARFFSGARLLMEVHGEAYFYWQRSRNPYHRFLSWLAFTNLKQADRVRALTPWFEKKLVDVGIPLAKIRVVPNRVSLETFDRKLVKQKLPIRRKLRIPQGSLVITCVGGYLPIKNHRLLLEAFSAINSEYPESMLVLIGDGPLRQQYERWITAHGLVRKVKLTGRIPPKGVANYLASSDIYVQPSFSEALPRAILEAWAMELPVIATNIEALAEIVTDRKTGLLIPSDDRSALTEALHQLAGNAGERRRLGENGCRLVRREYEWHKNFSRYRALLMETAGV